MDNIGKNIQKVRTKADFKQKQLAQALGLDQATISRFENNSRSPSIKLLKRMAEIFGCSFAELVTEEPEESGNSKIVKTKKNMDDSEENFVRTLLVQNPDLSSRLRSLTKRSKELTPDDWQFLADHLIHAFSQIEMLLSRKNSRNCRQKNSEHKRQS
jgi:transcriptional regulator with XRE-family HTH domain